MHLLLIGRIACCAAEFGCRVRCGSALAAFERDVWFPHTEYIHCCINLENRCITPRLYPYLVCSCNTPCSPVCSFFLYFALVYGSLWCLRRTARRIMQTACTSKGETAAELGPNLLVGGAWHTKKQQRAAVGGGGSATMLVDTASVNSYYYTRGA